MRLTRWLIVASFFVALRAQGAGFLIVDAEIDAAPNQQIPITGVGTEAIMGMDLYAQVHGAPLAITDMSIVGTLWEFNNTGPGVFVYPNDAPNAQVAVLFVTTAAGFVNLPGTVGVLIVDATGLGGQTATITTDTEYSASDFALVAADTFVDGTITIRSNQPPANLPPVIDAGAPQTVHSGDTVNLAGTAADPESHAMTYAWAQTAGPAVVLADDQTLTPSFLAPDVNDATDLTFELTVSDGTNTPTDAVTITVQPAGSNLPPVIDAGAPQTVHSGDTVNLAGTAADPESHAMTYAWSQTAGPAVVLADGQTLTPSFLAPDVNGATDLTFELTVSDGTDTPTDTVTITVQPVEEPVDQPPVIDAGSNQTVTSGDTVILAGSASDPEHASLTYAWTHTGGPIVTLSGATTLQASFVAPDVQQSTTITFQLTVWDGTNAPTDSVMITVEPPPADLPPTVDAGPNQTVNSGDTVALNGAATDPEGGTITYAWTRTAGPTVTLTDASTLYPSFVAPVVEQATTLTFRLTVSDGTNLPTDTVTITVLPAEAPVENLPPTVDAGTARSVASGDSVVLTGTANDPENATLTYAWTRTAGVAFALNGLATPTLSFVAPTVTQPTTIVFTLTVSDGVNSAFDTVVVVVNPAPTPDPGDTDTGHNDNTDNNNGGTDTSGNQDVGDTDNTTDAVTAPPCGAGASQAASSALVGLVALGLASHRRRRVHDEHRS